MIWDRDLNRWVVNSVAVDTIRCDQHQSVTLIGQVILMEQYVRNPSIFSDGPLWATCRNCLRKDRGMTTPLQSDGAESA